MYEQMSTLQLVLLGALVLAVLFWFGGGLGQRLRESREAPKDWPGLILPLAAVAGFVLLLMWLGSR